MLRAIREVPMWSINQAEQLNIDIPWLLVDCNSEH